MTFTNPKLTTAAGSNITVSTKLNYTKTRRNYANKGRVVNMIRNSR